MTMHAEIVTEAVPPPPRRVMLNMSEAEARILALIAATNVGVPEAVENYTDTPRRDTWTVLRALADALDAAGVKF